MATSSSNIPTIGGNTRISLALQACFSDLVTGSPDEVQLKSRLLDDGWARHGGFNLARVLRRITAWRHGKIGILTRSGYTQVHQYCQSQQLIGKHLSGFMDGAVSYRTHLLHHDRWKNATALVAEGKRHRDNRGHSVGLWVFINRDETLLDPFQYAETFNGSGANFFTPFGNRCDTKHQWKCEDSDNGGAYGYWRKPGRDWSSREFYSDRFTSRMLPQFALPANCNLYSVTSHSRYY